MIIKDFYAEWCPPCKTMEPVIEELAKKGVTIEKINIDDNMELAQNYGVMSIPTFVIENDGKEVTRFTGITDKDEIQKALDR